MLVDIWMLLLYSCPLQYCGPQLFFWQIKVTRIINLSLQHCPHILNHEIKQTRSSISDTWSQLLQGSQQSTLQHEREHIVMHEDHLLSERHWLLLNKLCICFRKLILTTAVNLMPSGIWKGNINSSPIMPTQNVMPPPPLLMA